MFCALISMLGDRDSSENTVPVRKPFFKFRGPPFDILLLCFTLKLVYPIRTLCYILKRKIPVLFGGEGEMPLRDQL